MPCTETVAPAGQRIFSLWQGATIEEVAAAVEGIVGDHCTSTLFPVMEDFAHGVDKEQLTDAALRVARRTGAKLQELDEKMGVTKTVTSSVNAITQKVNEQTAPVLEKVQQNETVQKVTDATVSAAATVNAKLNEGLSWVHARLNPPAKVNAPDVLTRPAGGESGNTSAAVDGTATATPAVAPVPTPVPTSTPAAPVETKPTEEAA
jgi:hypothetical protein